MGQPALSEGCTSLLSYTIWKRFVPGLTYHISHPVLQQTGGAEHYSRGSLTTLSLSRTFPRTLIAQAIPTCPTPTTVILLFGTVEPAAMGVISFSFRVAMVFCKEGQKGWV